MSANKATSDGLMYLAGSYKAEYWFKTDVVNNFGASHESVVYVALVIGQLNPQSLTEF